MKQCHKCGGQIPARVRWGICPKCLLEPGAPQATDDSAEAYTASFSQERRRFGDYQLGTQIGRGGMGVVYQAVQLRLRRPVALKMILDSHISSPGSRRRFAIEAEAAAKLDHPNIVPIYEVGEHGDQPFLSMKLVDGDSLRNRIASGELCVGGNNGAQAKSGLRTRQLVAARLMALVARAVHHAHEKGVLHRDLKPGNIIVDRAGQPHLTDFGLAKLLDQVDGDGAASNSSVLMGSPPYMPPEQASNQSLTIASDVYGLGAILYELLTGRPPFKASTIVETIRQVVEQEPTRPRVIHPGIDADLETVCLKCLEKNPATRYSSALAVAEDLERWSRQEPIHARPAGPVLHARRWIKRNPVGTGLIASLCAGLVASLLMLQMAYQQRKHLDILAVINLNEFTQRVEEFWADPERDYVVLDSSKLAALIRRIPHEPDPRTLTLSFAVTIGDNPIGQATAFAPFLAALQDRMAKLLGRPVLFNLRLYKTRSWDSPAVGRGEVDVQRMSPLTYVRLTQANLGVQPVARSREKKEAVIFARTNTGILHLREIPGHSVAFAHTNSIISFWAKVYLARAGICATNLKSYGNLASGDYRASGRAFSSPDPSEIEMENYAHQVVIDNVLRGEYDVGVAPWRHFESRRRGTLVEVSRYPVPYNIVVARRGLDPELVVALRRAIVSLDKRILRQLGRGAADSFDAAVDSDFDDTRKALEELKCFENVQSPGGAETSGLADHQ